VSFRFRKSPLSGEREEEEKQEMCDRDLSVPFLLRYTKSYEDTAESQRDDTEYEQSTAVPTQGSRSAGVHHHRSRHAGEVPGKRTKGHNEIRGGDECEAATSRDMPVHR